MSTTLRLVLVILATWRITHLLAEEDGPGDIVVRVRARLGDSAVGRAMDCFFCLSVWIAAPFALVVARTVGDWFLTWLAVSGGACLLERVTARPESDTTVDAEPSRRKAYGLLRWQAPGVPSGHTADGAGADRPGDAGRPGGRDLPG